MSKKRTEARKKNAAAAALSALRWRGNVPEPTQPRRIKVSTIERLKAHQARIGAATMDAAIVDLLCRAENGADGKKEG